jgi:hypothetical protein
MPVGSRKLRMAVRNVSRGWGSGSRAIVGKAENTIPKTITIPKKRERLNFAILMRCSPSLSVVPL